MKDQEWNLIRKVTYWVLKDLDGTIELSAEGFMPTTIRELDLFARGLDFEFQLDRTLKFTSEALREVASKMAALHRVAAAIQVNAPSAEEIAAVQQDLQTISDDLKNDQRFKAGVALAGALAGIIGTVRH